MKTMKITEKVNNMVAALISAKDALRYKQECTKELWASYEATNYTDTSMEQRWKDSVREENPFIKEVNSRASALRWALPKERKALSVRAWRAHEQMKQRVVLPGNKKGPIHDWYEGKI